IGVGANLVHGAGGAGGELGADGVAGGDDGAPCSARETEAIELAGNGIARLRHVGDEDDDLTSSLEARQRSGGARKDGAAIVDDAPDVAEDRIVAIRDVVDVL